MYKITFPDGKSVLTDKPDFIRVHKENCFILCDRSKAEGIAYHGGPFLFADGTQCHEVDGGDQLLALQTENAALREQLAVVEDALCELDMGGFIE